MAIRLPNDSQHIAIAGRTGSGKTVAALGMLAQRDMTRHAQIMIDFKRDEEIAKLPAEKLNMGSLFMPTKGLHVVFADSDDAGLQQVEDLLERAYARGNTGIYIDEGHLMNPRSKAVRKIMVTGRSKHVTMMWTSQRAHWIDAFIWSQASFYRVFQLQGPSDIKRFNEYFPRRYQTPDEYHSFYYDVGKGQQGYLAPSEPIEMTVARLEQTLKVGFRGV